MRLLGDEIVAELAGVPAFELNQEVREESLWQTRLRIEQRRCQRDHYEEQEEYRVNELQQSSHVSSNLKNGVQMQIWEGNTSIMHDYNKAYM